MIKTLVYIPIITIDFLNQGNIDICQTTYQATSSNILGLIFPTYLDPTNHNAYFRADRNDNNPVYLSRPRQNYFHVRIVNNANPPILWVDEAGTPLDLKSCVLILSFEECE